jgi:hypothetical protein
MTNIQDVHPTVCRSMETTVLILRNAIAYRQREIADMEAAIIACQVLCADESLPRLEPDPGDLEKMNERLENALTKELTDQRRPKLAALRGREAAE